MAVAELKQLVDAGDLAGFETRCLEALAAGTLQIAELVTPFRQLEQHPQGARVAALGALVLDNCDSAADPASALAIARTALLAEPTNAEMRKRVISQFKAVYSERPGFGQLLDNSGLESGRPTKAALRTLEFGLSLESGHSLVSRSEGVAVEVSDVDLLKGLITVRREGRSTTLTVPELAREYERATANDFRVLRQLHPERLERMVRSESVALTIGIIQAHAGQITEDELKGELSPKYIPAAEWKKWWTDTKSKLKKHPNVTLEGRSPVVLGYSKQARTIEDDTWDKFIAQNEPDHWLSTIEGYLRDRRTQSEPADKIFLERCHAHIVAYIKAIKDRRPGEALACAIVTQRLDVECGLAHSDVRNLEQEMLRDAPKPAALIVKMTDTALWEGALEALAAARPADSGSIALELLPHAPASVLDSVVALAEKGGQLPGVQAAIDESLTEPHRWVELMYWMWKGSAKVEGLKFPTSMELFTRIVETLNALGKTLNPAPDVTREFRGRMRTVLALRDYAQAKSVIQNISPERAIRLRTELDRLDGVGDNCRTKLLDLLRDAQPHLWYKAERRLQPWEDEAIVWTTRAGMQRKTEERDHLVNVTMRENAKRIGEAAALGDLSENSEYKFALEERDLLRARLAQMNTELSIADVIDPQGVPTDRVGIGSRVTMRDVSTGATQVLTFLGPFDGDIERGIYNYRAPMAQRFMGQAVGARIKASVIGAEEEFEIVAIENGLAG